MHTLQKGRLYYMTKGEYCEIKKLHICNPKIDLEEEIDDNFKEIVDVLTDYFEEIYNDNDEDI